MEQPPITLDPATLSQLPANPHDSPVPIQNPAGEIIGYFVPPLRMAKMAEEHKALYESLDRLFPPEDIARMKERMRTDTRPRRTMDEVLRLVEGQ